MNLNPDCNRLGAWLMVSLQDDKNPVTKAIVVITFWFHYANVVADSHKRDNPRSCTRVFR
jgi:hypothetical protein